MRIRKAKELFQVVGAMAALSIVGMGCNGASDERQVEEQTGRLSVECVGGMSTHGVSAVRFVVVGTEGTCADTPIAEKVVMALENESIPASLLPAGGGSAHPFADGLFTLAPGSYRVCATPLAAGIPSAECGMVDTTVLVKAELTTEIVLMSQCKGDPTGAVDAVLGLNDPPRIDDLTVAQSKFINVCEKATITVHATDPNHDAMTYSGAIVSGPTGTPGSITFAANVGTFSPGSPGDYEVKVTVTDAVGGSTPLQFPIHVTAATCMLVSLVGDKDDFASSSDPADIPEVDSAFATAVGDQWAPTSSLDSSVVDGRVLLSHIFTLPAGAVVQSASLQLHLMPDAQTTLWCADTDGIFFEPPFVPHDKHLILHDLVGDMPVPGQKYTFDIDLAATPARDILTTDNQPGPCLPWSSLPPGAEAPKVQLNLLPKVQSGVFNLLLVDDTSLDYSQLTVQYTIP